VRTLRAVIVFLAYSHVWLALAIVSLCYATHTLLQLPGKPAALFLCMIAGAVLLLYNLHYYHTPAGSSPRALWLQQNRLAVRGIMVAGGIVATACCIFLLTQLQHPLPALFISMATAFGAASYSLPLLPAGTAGQRQRIRDTGWFKLPWLATCLTLVALLLPMAFADATLALPLRGNLLAANYLCFFLLLGLLFDCRDIETDAGRGLRTPAVWLGKGPTLLFLLLALPLEACSYISLLEQIYPGKMVTLLGTPVVLLTILILLRLQKTTAHLPYLLLGDGLILLKSIFALAASGLFR
jgi:hypothetical protein